MAMMAQIGIDAYFLMITDLWPVRSRMIKLVEQNPQTIHTFQSWSTLFSHEQR